MALQQVIEIYELLDSAKVNGEQVAQVLQGRGVDEIEVIPIKGEKGTTDSIKVRIPGQIFSAKKQLTPVPRSPFRSDSGVEIRQTRTACHCAKSPQPACRCRD